MFLSEFELAPNIVITLLFYLNKNGSLSAVINIPSWLARTTLDTIRRDQYLEVPSILVFSETITATFDYGFGAIDEREDEFSAVYKNLL